MEIVNRIELKNYTPWKNRIVIRISVREMFLSSGVAVATAFSGVLRCNNAPLEYPLPSIYINSNVQP